ncbi:MAG: group III truncated hemoglobin [Bradyrhizobium sp.]|uniref:group III truncated hemoglobin n=1 Tax=Bradyrhizobium sp. TaxID=376 RepID=UPI001C295A4D|nr:group III truncated hemoglobin [Bradyrhizobium sp.]MBU6461614.1 group III truncated hemoglobin [Pseudomonadota bacterium]MDE2066724.1 group III truncated hemoglobin [Bradyrhizobium sp.]MDE2242492.1 group III truncated hemoglobin [Bradyrhizobium sp.]
MTASVARQDHVSEEGIQFLVDGFYAKVRRDPELAPIFLRAIPGDWGPHLNKMYAFWSSVMLRTGRYKGNPVVKHFAVPGIQPALFERWLALFKETADELFDDAISAEFQARAERIAESLKLALFYRPDRPWPPVTVQSGSGGPVGPGPA